VGYLMCLFFFSYFLLDLFKARAGVLGRAQDSFALELFPRSVCDRVYAVAVALASA
jgi:hypothetical protein